MLVVGAAICAFLALGVCAADTNEITSITLNKGATDIQIDVALTKEYVDENKSSTLYVFELLPYQSTSQIDSLEPVAEFKPAEKASVKLSYLNGNANRLYSKFLVAEMTASGSYNIVTSAKYIENLDILCENTEDYPAPSGKKGLQIQLFSDAQLLGVQHVTINVPLNEYILGENLTGAMSFVYNGQTYYLNKEKMDLLDHRVRTYSEAGIMVYLNIILARPTLL